MNARTGEYSIHPLLLENIVDTFTAETDELQTFADRCLRVGPLIATIKEVHGLDTIPREGPLIVVKNHPCHYDSLLLDAIFAARPGIRLLAKPSALMQRLPANNTLLMRKVGPHGDLEDIQALQAHLKSGGSLLATPWGSLDHQARENTTLERTIQNVQRFASFASATVLPVSIETDWSGDAQLPLDRVIITYGPALSTTEETNTDMITSVITHMYEQFAH